MALPAPEPIYFLITDLAPTAKVLGVLRSRFKRLTPSRTPKEPKSSLSLYHAVFKHWAVRIRDRCYEVNDYKEDGEKPGFKLYNGTHFDEWQRQSERKGVLWEPIRVGTTLKSDEEIFKQAELVWTTRIKGKYKLMSSNCQSFAYCLCQVIAPELGRFDNEKQIQPYRFTQVRNILERFAPLLARGLVMEGMELGAEALAIIGLEVLGFAVLGPIGEIILIAAIITPLLLVRSDDTKWLKSQGKLFKAKIKFKRKDKKKEKKKNDDKQQAAIADYPEESESDMFAEHVMEKLIDEIAEKAENPYKISNTYAEQKFPQELGVVAINEPQQHDDFMYGGYNKASMDRYVELGFSAEHVVAVLRKLNIDANDGKPLTLNEADHHSVVDGLLEEHGYDEVVSSSMPKIPPRKPLPTGATVYHRGHMMSV